MNSSKNMKKSAGDGLQSGRIVQRDLRDHEPEADHISRLPIDIVLKIFNFLPLESWLTMSTVSKHFKPLRTHIPYLDIDQAEMEGNFMRNNICPIYGGYHHGPLPKVCHPYCAIVTRTELIRSVDRILNLHSGSKMNRLSLFISYYERDWNVPIVNSWVSFALTRNIEEVELQFNQSCLLSLVRINGLRVITTNLASLYALPFQRSPSKVLTVLKLNACQFKASCLGILESLRILNLASVHLIDSNIEHWHSILPMLSELSMDCCVLEDKFFVTDKVFKIEYLSICYCMTSTRMMFPISITVPNLITFQFYGTYLEGSSIRGADKLKDVHIDIDYLVADRLQGKILSSLLQDLRSCQCLELDSWCLQVLASTQSSSMEYLLQLQKTTKLTLNVFMTKQELPGICYLLRRCPLLQTLTMELQSGFPDADIIYQGFVPNVFDFEDNYWEFQNMPFNCLQNSLKTISFLEFTGQDMELHILKFLLQNAMVLEELHIGMDDDTLHNADAVKNFQRVSPQARVIINGELAS